MEMFNYYAAIHTLRLSEEENIKEAGEHIEAFVDDLISQHRRSCSKAATYKLQRDIERKEKAPPQDA
jgi:hypothetical protein